MITERMVDGLIYPTDKEMIDDMDGELTKVVNDFTRAVDVETLRLAKKSGKHPLFQSGHGTPLVVCVEQELLLGRLKPVETGYDLDRCCMEGTRQSILNQIVAWVTNPQER